MQRRKPLVRRKGLKAGRRAGAGDRLWRALQEHPVARFGFRREERIGPFVVDIVCPSAKLAILREDGEASREQWLEAAGWRVLTFSKAEDPKRILEAIEALFDLRAVR